MLGFVLAILACTGTNCELTNLEPAASFPTYEACQAELTAKAPSFKGQLDQARSNTRTAEAVCVREIATITEVEFPYDVIDTAIVHREPSANSPYVGIVEAGKRTLVTGMVAGTQWVRVVLADGKTGYVFVDHLRQVGGAPPPAAETLAAPPQTVPAAPAQTALAAPPAAGPTAQNPPSASEQTASRNPGVPAETSSPRSGPNELGHAPPAASSGTSAFVGAVPRSGAQQREFQDCGHCPIMVALPGGEFAMGSNADPTERPMHRVRIHPFAIGKFELSVAEWQACVASGGCSYKPGAPNGAPDRYPMENLSWDDATEYVHWLQRTTGKPYRLLTEAEWEYAARAGTETCYSWGEELKPGRANCEGCGPNHDRSRPGDIGSFPPNAWVCTTWKATWRNGWMTAGTRLTKARRLTVKRGRVGTAVPGFFAAALGTIRRLILPFRPETFTTAASGIRATACASH